MLDILIDYLDNSYYVCNDMFGIISSTMTGGVIMSYIDLTYVLDEDTKVSPFDNKIKMERVGGLKFVVQKGEIKLMQGV